MEISKPKAKHKKLMLDTIQPKHFYRTLARNDFQRNWKHLTRARNPTWILNEKGAKALPNLSIIYTPDGIWHLSALVSLPKMIFGHNARLPNQAEVIEGLHKISEYVQEKSGLPFDIPTATVNLVHFTYDIHLGESEVWKTVLKLSAKRLPPLQKNFYEDSTLYFTARGKTRQIRIYPKLQEVLSNRNATAEAIEMAKGVLRFEHSLLKPYSIDSFVKRHSLSDKTTLSLLNEDASDLAISEVLDNLNFYELLSNDKTRLDLLREHFPTRKAMNLYGFLEMVNERGENFYKDETLGFSKDSYYSDLRNCRKANVW